MHHRISFEIVYPMIDENCARRFLCISALNFIAIRSDKSRFKAAVADSNKCVCVYYSNIELITHHLLATLDDVYYMVCVCEYTFDVMKRLESFF